jgi:hypothetical protein
MPMATGSNSNESKAKDEARANLLKRIPKARRPNPKEINYRVFPPSRKGERYIVIATAAAKPDHEALRAKKSKTKRK